MAVLDLELSKAILKQAQEGEYLDVLPEADDEVIELAEFYAKEANNAYETVPGMKRDKTVNAIRNLYKEGIERKNERAVQEFFHGIDQDLVDEFGGLPTPPDLHGDPSEMPVDFTEIGDKQLRKLHGEYNAYLARARWMLAVTLNKLAGATHLRDEAYRNAYKKAIDTLEAAEAKSTKDILDALAKDDEKYQEYDKAARRHQEDATSYKALVDIYSGNVDRLSRDWTMRQEQEKRY